MTRVEQFAERFSSPLDDKRSDQLRRPAYVDKERQRAQLVADRARDSGGLVQGLFAESQGCIRLATANIDWLAARIGPGIPAKIY